MLAAWYIMPVIWLSPSGGGRRCCGMPGLHEGVIGFAVVAMNINYKAPAKLDDLLTVETKLTKVGGASMEMQQEIYMADKLITELKVSLVSVDRTFKAVRLPAEIKKIFDSKT